MEIGKKLNILHLLSQTELTGSEVHSQVLIQQQIKSGHGVFVISEKWNSEKKCPVLLIPTHSAKGLKRISNYWKIRQFLIKNKIDVIHCHSRAAAKHARFARLGLPIACVTTLHGRPHFSWSKILFDEWGDKVIAICENVQKTMIEKFKMKFSKIDLTRNPFDCKQYQFSSIQHQHFESAVKPFHLAIIGRSSGPKGRRTEKLIQSEASLWLKSFPKLTIHIISAKPDHFSPNFLWQVQKLNQQFENRILLYKNQKPIEQLYPDFQMVIGSGRVAVEAGLSGCMTLAFGEYEYSGPLNRSNYSNCLSSNFGDIGLDSMESSFDPKAISKDVLDLIQKPLSYEERMAIRVLLEKDFSFDQVYQQVMVTYLSSIFKRKHPKTIPVLMYHRVPDSDPKSIHKIYVVKNQFEKQMRLLKTFRRSVISLKDFVDVFYLKKDLRSLGSNPVILTFDDGYQDNLTNAEPILKQHQFRASLFLLADHSITVNNWDQASGEPGAQLMNLSQKQQLDLSVWSIGSHGLQHLSYTELPIDRIESQMIQSKSQLENDLKTSIETIVYPFGHTSPQISRLAQQSGYLAACNTDQGGLHIADWPFSIFRVNIFPNDGFFALWKKTQPGYRQRFYRKHNK